MEHSLVSKEENADPELRLMLEQLDDFVVCIEGNISAGKSTLAEKLKAMFPDLVEIFKEETHQPLLKLLYKGQGYEFAFQMVMLATRRYQLRLAQELPQVKNARAYFWDRSGAGDWIFALWNYFRGKISPKELKTYEKIFGGNIHILNKLPWITSVKALVWLSDEPAACKRRADKVRQNEAEVGLPLDYYEGIDDMHFDVFMRFCADPALNVRILCWGQYNTVTDALKHITSHRYRASVRHHVYSKEEETQLYQSILDKGEDLITSEVAVNNRYDLSHELYQSNDSFVLNSDDENLAKSGFLSKQIPESGSTVWISRMMMHRRHTTPIDPFESHGIRLFKNNYKRLVAYYLSRGVNVVFLTREDYVGRFVE